MQSTFCVEFKNLGRLDNDIQCDKNGLKKNGYNNVKFQNK